MINNKAQCNCNPGYYINSGSSNGLYCDRCFIGCLTCTGPLSTNCITCSTDFIYNSNQSTCTAPQTTTDYMLQQSYYFLSFNPVTGWSSSAQTCGMTTLLGTATTITFAQNNYFSNPHFAVRVMFAHYLDATSMGTSISTTLVISYDGGTTNFSPIAITASLANWNNPTFACASTTKFVMTYVDVYYTHTSPNISLKLYTGGNSFAIREFYMLSLLCNSVCLTCNGYYSSNCTSCADSTRSVNVTTATNNYTGQCICSGNYYQEPTALTCVQICPSVPVELFGDNLTRNCLSSCPNGSYAYTDTYLCVADCPLTSSITGAYLFKDNINRRCVSTCP